MSGLKATATPTGQGERLRAQLRRSAIRDARGSPSGLTEEEQAAFRTAPETAPDHMKQVGDGSGK